VKVVVTADGAGDAGNEVKLNRRREALKQTPSVEIVHRWCAAPEARFTWSRAGTIGGMT